MGLFVSTVGSDVVVSELGITISHPTTDFDLEAQFSDEELSKAYSLTTAIQSGALIWRTTAGGSNQVASNYDPDHAEVETLSSGPGVLQSERLVRAFGTPVNRDGLVWNSVSGEWEVGSPVKNGILNPSDFAGNPKKATVTFASNFPNTNYALTIMGTTDSRAWTAESVTVSGFVVNSNANQTITGVVRWAAELGTN